LERLTAAISAATRPGQVVRVKVDGVDGAEKTVLADELADVLRQRDGTAPRASADGSHHPAKRR
jgi:uridine kinase